jgi:hypothetical protein
MSVERSGIHLTGADSGWPVASASEPAPHKDGTGTDGLTHTASVTDGVVLDTAATNEVQLVTLTSATGGTFLLTFNGQTTAAIAYNATAAAVKAALVALSNIDTGDIDVAGNAGGPYTITFKGAYANQNVAQITADGALLTGSGHNVSATTSVPGAD